MRIDTLTAGKIYDDWNSIPVHQTVEKLSSNQEALSSCAEWGKIRLETSSSTMVSTEEEFHEHLHVHLEEALDAEQYEKALRIIDQINDFLDKYGIENIRDLPHNFPHDFEVQILSGQSYCLKELGRLKEAYFFATEAIEKFPPLLEKAKEEALASIMEMVDIPSEEWPSTLPAFIDKTINESFAEIQRDLLVDRGFLALASNQKELAIDDFREAARCECDNSDKSEDPEFLFRVLEKALGTQIAPFKNCEKEIVLLLQESYLDQEKRYQLLMCYALLGQHDKALEWYEKIEQDNFPPEVPFFLAYLNGDMETARKEIEHCPDKDYKLIINHDFSAFNTRPLTQTLPTGISLPKASMSESAASTSKDGN